MTGGETLFLIGVIVAFVAFSAMLAYSLDDLGQAQTLAAIPG